MNDSDLVIAATYFSEAEAHIVRTRLEAGGYFSAVFKDDLGGIYPNLQGSQGVRLMVRKADLEEIQKIIAEEAVE